jgi:zinc transport system permease protein
MTDFLDALSDPAIPFLRYALLAGALASVGFGIVGSYVVARRITYIAAAISHCVLGGIGVALYLQKAVGLAWCDPMYGAVAAALLSALVIGVVSLSARQREDTVISAVWVVGMAVGLLFLQQTPGYNDAMSYLFGDINYISRHDLWLVAALDILVVGLAVLFHNKFVAVCFDEEFVELRGVRAKLYFLFLLCLTALAVVSLVRIVGNVMVIALLTLPSAVAGHFSRRLWQMMTLATLFCLAFIVAGIGVSYTYQLLSGPVIILIAGVVYLAVAVGSRWWRTV